MLTAARCFIDKESELGRSKAAKWDVATGAQSWRKSPKFAIPKVPLQTESQERANTIWDVSEM